MCVCVCACVEPTRVWACVYTWYEKLKLVMSIIICLNHSSFFFIVAESLNQILKIEMWLVSIGQFALEILISADATPTQHLHGF